VFGVGLPEVAVILVVAVIVFGPDRLPEFARQAGRMVRQLRTLAVSAQDHLREELGPEYSDLKLSDLDPRVAIRKHIMEALEEDDLERAAIETARLQAFNPLPADELPPYDPEST
jgi:sec-independent protein translocase protein TatB